jgi:hypothetical protein
MAYNLFAAYFTEILIQEAKNPDYIMCKDYRDHDSKQCDKDGLPIRLRYPEIYFFDLKMT